MILFPNGAPNDIFNQTIGADPWTLSNAFRQQNIILIVVGIEPNIVECDDFYCALTKNTG